MTIGNTMVAKIYRWFAWRQWLWLPSPIRRWQQQYQEDAIYQLVAPSVLAAQAQGIGIIELWASPDATQSDVLQWINEQFAPSPHPFGRAADVVKLLIAHCSEEEFEYSESGGSLHLPTSALIVQWFGARVTWYWEGYDVVEHALPERHSGLYIAVNNIGAAFATVPTAEASHMPYQAVI